MQNILVPTYLQQAYMTLRKRGGRQFSSLHMLFPNMQSTTIVAYVARLRGLDAVVVKGNVA